MDAEEGFFGLRGGAVDCHGDGWVVVFKADELVAPEHSARCVSMRGVDCFLLEGEIGRDKTYLGPMWPPLILGAKRRWIFLMSLGRTNAPEPRRMERSFVCSLRMRCASEFETMLAGVGVRVGLRVRERLLIAYTMYTGPPV